MSDLRLPSHLPDAALAERILAQGDDAAFRVMYRRHTPALCGMLRRMASDDTIEMDDVIQDVWIRAVEGLGRFRWQSSFRTWLIGIGRNRVLELLRRRPPESAGLETSIVPGNDVETSVDVERALAQLPDGYRTVLLLHDLEGLTHPEISGRLDIAVGTSRSQLFNARRAMRRILTGGERKNVARD